MGAKFCGGRPLVALRTDRSEPRCRGAAVPRRHRGMDSRHSPLASLAHEVGNDGLQVSHRPIFNVPAGCRLCLGARCQLLRQRLARSAIKPRHSRPRERVKRAESVGNPCREMTTAAAVQNSSRTTRNLSPSVSNPRGQTVRFFHPLQTLPYNSPRDLPRDPGAHRASGGSVGAGLAGGRFSLLGDEPPSPGLAAADGGNAEATERGKQPGGTRGSRHVTYLSEGTASRPAYRTTSS